MGINAIVGQSGGPTCVINSSLAGVFSACRRHGVQKVFGMRHGVQGLLKDEVIDLTEALDAPGKLSLLRHTPASYLGSWPLQTAGKRPDGGRLSGDFRRAAPL